MDDAGIVIGTGNRSRDITMSQGLPRGVDLSGLPPEVRRKVEIGLAKLSPEMRQQWEQQGSPLLAKLVSGLAASASGKSQPPPVPKRAGERDRSTSSHSATPPRPGGMDLPPHAPHHTNPRSTPRGHYNDTIRPGDGRGFGSWPVWVFVAGVIIAILEY